MGSLYDLFHVKTYCVDTNVSHFHRSNVLVKVIMDNTQLLKKNIQG